MLTAQYMFMLLAQEVPNIGLVCDSNEQVEWFRDGDVDGIKIWTKKCPTTVP